MQQEVFIPPPRVEDAFDSTSPQMFDGKFAFLGCLGIRCMCVCMHIQKLMIFYICIDAPLQTYEQPWMNSR